MKQPLLIVLVTVILVQLSAPVAAQAPQLSLPTYNEAAGGSIISVPVTVSNFDSIISIGMVLHWDPAVIRFIGVTDYNTTFPDFNSDDIGITNAVDGGELRVVWFRFSPVGFSIPDGDTLFTIRYRVSGPLNSGTPIVVTELNPSLIFEIQKASGQTYSLQDMDLEDGFVAIGYTVSDTNIQQETISYAISPNPAYSNDELFIHFENNTKETTAKISVLTLGGKLIFQEKKEIQQGTNRTALHLPSKINYTAQTLLVQLEVGGKQAIQKLMLLP